MFLYFFPFLFLCELFFFFFFKQKTAYVMRIRDWSSDVCSSDLLAGGSVGLPRHRLSLSPLPQFSGRVGKNGAPQGLARRSVRECWYRDPIRHPGLVPGSNVPQALPLVEGWMLEQVRHDGRDPCRTSEPAAHCSISTVEGWCLSRCFLMIRRLRVFDRKKKSGTAPTNGIRPSRKSRPTLPIIRAI